jgi:L-threonylcarbamoyladenylate synthase
MGRIGDIGESQIYGELWRDKISQELVRGAVIVYPKGRPEGMPLSFAFAKVEDILAWTDASPTAVEVMRKNLPGPLTFVLPANDDAPKYIVNADGTLGVRIPDNETIRMLLADAGPLSATSANIHGGRDPRTAEDVPDELASKVDYVLNFGPCKHAQGSTIIKIIGDDITLLREGVVPLRELKR